METRLKERLTGAAILVALVVLLVPEMFRGQHVDAPASGAGIDGPPLRSYTIDLRNDSTRTAPLQTVANPAPSPSVAPAPRPAAAPSQQPATSVAATPEPEPAPVAAAPPAAAPAPSPIAPPRTISAPSGWSVQLGLFAKRENAERLAHSAQEKGFAVNVSSPDGKGLYRVRSQATNERANALALLQQLKAQGFPGALTTAQ